VLATPDQWQLDHRGLAGLFTLHDFAALTALDFAVCMDSCSEIALFGLAPGGRRSHQLFDALNQPERPHLAEMLESGEVFVHLAVVRDRFLGWNSYLTVKTLEPTNAVYQLAKHYSIAFARYIDRLDEIRTLDDFHDAMEDLLAPPTIRSR
jgi:hypothetical protein